MQNENCLNYDNIFSCIATFSAKPTQRYSNNQQNRRRALRNVCILEKILSDPDSAMLRKRILEIAKQRNLLRPIDDRCNVYFKILLAIPGTRKIAHYMIFPQVLVNDLDSPQNVRSYFFRSTSAISPRLEIIKTG